MFCYMFWTATLTRPVSLDKPHRFDSLDLYGVSIRFSSLSLTSVNMQTMYDVRSIFVRDLMTSILNLSFDDNHFPLLILFTFLLHKCIRLRTWMRMNEKKRVIRLLFEKKKSELRIITPWMRMESHQRHSKNGAVISFNGQRKMDDSSWDRLLKSNSEFSISSRYSKSGFPFA